MYMQLTPITIRSLEFEKTFILALMLPESGVVFTAQDLTEGANVLVAAAP